MGSKSKNVFTLTEYDNVKKEYKKVVQVKKSFENLTIEQKIFVLNQLSNWVHQERNNLFPEQE